ncbi:hypothetical protein [Rathayibacter sp. AY1D1]|uniref:hypothetical protein n=1 Tax=Rathayibacter sp. AY1D1 TaxID=2080542 RepID=UPI0011AFFA68|nr:hypothetical protein [Rathayibacter sp. AY1D1]
MARAFNPAKLLSLLAVMVFFAAVGRARRAQGPDGGELPSELQVLDREVLKVRSIEIFPNAYVTALSIVLGIALGTAAMSFSTIARDQSSFDLIAPGLRVFTVFIASLVIFYNYVWFLAIFRWALGVMDSLIPLILGSSVIALAAAIDFPDVWFVFLSAMYVVGALSFWYTIRRSTKAMFKSVDDFTVADRLLRHLRGIAAVGAVVIGALGAFYSDQTCTLYVAVGFTGLLAMVMIILSERALSSIYIRNRLIPRGRRTL